MFSIPKFYQPGAVARLSTQAPALANALASAARQDVLVFPLPKASWNGLRDEFVTVMESNSDCQVVHWLPALEALDDIPLREFEFLPEDIEMLIPRVHNALLENLIGSRGVKTWRGLGMQKVRDFRSMRGIGFISFRALLAFLIDVGIRIVWPAEMVEATPKIEDASRAQAYHAGLGVAPAPLEAIVPPLISTPPPKNPEQTVERTLDALIPMIIKAATWALSEHGADGPLDALKLALSTDAPEEIREAVEYLHLAKFPPTSLPGLAEVCGAFLLELQGNRRAVFEGRVLRPQSGTLASIGEELGITRERVRQIEQASERTALEILDRHDYRWLRWRAHSLITRLGPIIPDDHPVTNEVLHELFSRPPSKTHKALLFWASGLLELTDGIWHREASQQRSLHECLNNVLGADGLPLETLRDQLAALGCHPAFSEAILHSFPNIHFTMGRYFSRRLTIPDKCVLALRQLGQPATPEVIVATAEMDNDLRSVTNRMQADDRIIRVSKDEYGLREWGLEEYAGIADAMAKAIDQRGGRAYLPDLLQEIPAVFGVSAASVRVYADAPMFVFENDWLRLRRDDEPYRADNQLSSRRHTFKFGKTLTLIQDIDAETLRGSGGPLFPDVTQALGVAPGQERIFEGEDFIVSVRWPKTGWAGGSIGSRRSTILSVDGRLGQRLRLDFDTHTSTVRATLIDNESTERLLPLARLRRLTGVPAETPQQALALFDEALGEPLVGVEAALRARGDEDVAELIQLLNPEY